MKAILEFNVDDPCDEKAHMRCVKSLHMALALYGIKEVMRGLWGSFEEESKNPADVKLELFYQKFADVFERYNIDVNELIE